MKFDKLSRYGIVARLQYVHKIPKYWVTMSASIKQYDQFPEWIIVSIQKFGQFPIWIIATAREEETLNALNYEVKVHLNHIFQLYLEGTKLIQWLKHELMSH